MQGQKSYLNVRNGDKSGFHGQVEESKFQEILEDKDKEIAKLTKAIKRLKKELKEKEQSGKQPVSSESNNGYLKTLLQREVSRYNQLRDILISVTDRIKKISQEINCEFSVFQNSVEMENIVKMLENANFDGSKSYRSSYRSFASDRSSSFEDEEIYVEEAIDQFEITIRGLMMKQGETNKLYKQSLQIQKQMQEELANCKAELKMQKKSKDLLQKLLEKNETQKNQIVNQINSIGNQQQIQQLKSKTKEEILLYYLKLNYRIKDLQKQKQDYLKSSTKDKQKQVKLYEALLTQVKGIKQRNRIRQSVA